jgi:hypothetical protein
MTGSDPLVNHDRPAALACAMMAVLLFMVTAVHGTSTERLPVAGRVERARISLGEIVVDAKLDTGALTSSLHAAQFHRFERDGKAWVAFEVAGNDGRSARIERPVVRVARVTSSLGTDEARPTITLGVCIGAVYRVTEVNLVDRGELTQALLVGRRFLRGRLLVDSRQQHLLEPSCPRRRVP